MRSKEKKLDYAEAMADMGAYIRKLRKMQGLTLRELGERTGFDHSKQSCIELGKANITFKTFAWIVSCLIASNDERIIEPPRMTFHEPRRRASK